MIDFDFKSVNIKRVLTLALCLYLIYLIPSLIVANISKGTPKCSCCKHKTQLTFWTLQLNSQEDYFKKLIKKFELENPDIKVNWVDVPYQEGEKKVLAALLTDNPPDLVNLTYDFSMTLAHKKVLDEIPEVCFKNYVKEIKNSLNYEEKYYAIPFYATSAVAIVNSDLYKKSKLNKKITTYDDVFANAKQVKQKTGKYIIFPTLTENDTVLKLLNKYDVDCSNLASEKSNYIFKEFNRLYNNDLIPKESITQGHQEALEQYLSGQTMMIVTGANFLNIIRENAPKVYEKSLVYPQLKGDNGKYDFSLMDLAIPVKSKHKTQAIRFAMFLTNEKNQYELAQKTSILPVNEPALERFIKNLSKNTTKSNLAQLISAKQLNNLSQIPYLGENKKEKIEIINMYVQKILFEKNEYKIKNILQTVENKVKNCKK